MARETKVGLLIGLGVILLIGIIVSDHVAGVGDGDTTSGGMTGFAASAQQSIDPGRGVEASPKPNSANSLVTAAAATLPGGPIPTPQELREVASVGATVPLAATTVPHPEPAPRTLSLLESGSAYDSPAAPPVPTRGVEELTLSRAQVPPAAAAALGEGAAPLPPSIFEPPVEMPATSTPAPEAVVHYVAANETLIEIARHFYGDGRYWTAIARANPQVGPNGEIQENQRLILPNKAGHVQLPPGVVLAAHEDEPIDVTPRGGQVPTALPRRVRQPRFETVTVPEGGSLSELAATHLGSASRWPELMAVNADKLARPEDLQAGMELKLPLAGTPSQAPEAADVNPRLPETPTYTVRGGDNLSLIAQRTLGSKARYLEIYQLNRDTLDSPDALVAGQTLQLPPR